MGWIPDSANDEYNVKTCLEINRLRINTELLSHSVIESGGVALFISGNKKTISSSSGLPLLLLLVKAPLGPPKPLPGPPGPPRGSFYGLSIKGCKHFSEQGRL